MIIYNLISFKLDSIFLGKSGADGDRQRWRGINSDVLTSEGRSGVDRYWPRSLWPCMHMSK